MFTRPSVDQCEMENVNKFLMAINEQVMVLIVILCPAAQTCVVVNMGTEYTLHYAVHNTPKALFYASLL